MKRRLGKQIISLVLVFCTLLSLLPVSALATQAEPTETESGVPFHDVAQDAWYYDSVMYAYVNGLVNGTGDTTFDPQGGMTRGMFVTVLGRMAGVNTENYLGQSVYSDVAADKYYAPYVAWASKHGITTGTGDGIFSPDALINRQQLATFFVRYCEAFDVEYGEDTVTTQPADIDEVADWAKDAVLTLWSKGILNGDGTNFNPTDEATRAEAVTLSTRMDAAVETWYSEPGVESDRVRIDPTTGEAFESENKEPEKPSTDNWYDDYYGGSDTTTSYLVEFFIGDLADEIKNAATPPQKNTYLEGTKIEYLPAPTMQNGLFLGWYYDAALTQPVPADATVTKSLKLYAKMGTVSPVSAEDTPRYITVQVAADNVTGYSFKIKGVFNAADITFINVSANNQEYTRSDTLSEYDAGGTPLYQYKAVSDGGGGYVITALWKSGQTYSIKLADDSSAVFVVGGAEQTTHIRTLNIITEKAEIMQLSVDDGVRYIAKDDSSLTGMSDSLNGLFTVALQSVTPEGSEAGAPEYETGKDIKITPVEDTGTFTFTGEAELSDNSKVALQVGDTVAIYTGTRPDKRGLTSDLIAADADAEDPNGSVAYVEITAINGSVYTYKTAESEDVLFTPDVLPLLFPTNNAVSLADDSEGGTFTVPVADMTYTDDVYAQMGLDSQTKVEAGDFIMFYLNGDNGLENATAASSNPYARITDVIESEGNYTITWVPVTEAEVMAAMDLYDTRNQAIVQDDKTIEEMENEMVRQAIESGFVDEAAEYLVALALETDGFENMDGDMDLSSYSITFEDGTPVDEETMALMAGNKAKITKKEVAANIMAGNVLQHFEDSTGLRAELGMEFTVEVEVGNGKIVIQLEAIFEQEVLLNINVSGGAVWKKWWIFPYIADYQMTANLDVGTYTGIAVTATVKTVAPEAEEEEEYKWESVTDTTFENVLGNVGEIIKDTDEAISKVNAKVEGLNDKIEELIDKGEHFLDIPTVEVPSVGLNGTESVGTVDDSGLAERYSAMMAEATDNWIEIVRVEIFSSEGHVDPLHILCYGIGADFVVSATMHVTVGMTFQFGVAKRYAFSLKLFARECTTETVDLEEANYSFKFYVMGTIGVRAGIEFEVAVGLFSLKLDSIGIAAEVGAYAQMWGYFYYELTWSKSEGKDSRCSGALFIEIGIYLSISFKAQLFSYDKLTYNPTLYENEWPLWSAGEAENVYEFYYPESPDDISEDDFKDEETEQIDTEAYEEEVAALTELLLPVIEGARSFTLSADLFNMNYMDMKTGVLHGSDFEEEEEEDDGFSFGNPIPGGDEEEEPHENSFPKNFDSNKANNGDADDEERFMVDVSNEYFSYDPTTNTVTVTAPKGTEQTCDITFTWKGNALAFSTKPMSRTVTITWSDPANAKFIAFDSRGGSAVPLISTGVGQDISAHKSTKIIPTKVGYTFEGWYESVDAEGNVQGDKFQFTTMGNYDEVEGVGAGITLYANWTPNSDTKYTVEHYLEELNGKYVLYADMNPDDRGWTLDTDTTVENKVGTTDELTQATTQNFAGFVSPSAEELAAAQQFIAPDGSTVVKLYYKRAEYTATFGYGTIGSGMDPVVSKAKYMGTVAVPALALGGYDFTGFAGLSDKSIRLDTDKEYTATWEARTDTPYRAELYVEKTDGSGYVLAADPHAIQHLTGTTGASINPTSDAIAKLADTTGLTYSGATVNGAAVSDSNLAVVTTDGKLVIKLLYNRNQYELKCMDGETQLGDTESIRYGAKLTEPEAPTKEGWTFAGWYTTTDFAEGTKVDFSTYTMPENGVTLYAKWTAGERSYTVNHYVQGVDGEYSIVAVASNQPTTTGAELTLSELVKSDLLRENVITYKEAKVGNSVVTKYEIPATGDVVIDLYYERAQYTLTWVLNDGVAGDAAYTAAGKVYAEAPITAPVLTKQGYTYTWTPEVASVMPAANAEYTAVWAAGTDTAYTVKHLQQNADDDGYTVFETVPMTGTTGEQTAAVAKDYSADGFRAGTFTDTAIAADGSTVVEIKYDRVTYTVTFDANDGTLKDDATMTFRHGQTFSVIDPEREDYAFAGWFEGETKFEAATVTKAMALTAHWTAGAVNYTVNHYVMGVDGTYPDAATFTESGNGIVGSTVTLSDLKKTDYEYEGSLGTAYDAAKTEASSTTVTVAKNMTVSIYYVRKSYTLTWEPDGGTIGSDAYTGGTVYYGAAITAPTVTKTGHTGGWTGVAATMPAADTTYTAAWTVNRYTITFNTDGGSAIADIEQDYNTAVTAPAAPTKTGYTFVKWVDENGSDATVPAQMPAENITLKAIWKAETYAISYVLDGGTIEGQPTTHTYGQTTQIANPTKTGYTFDGWTVNGGDDKVTDLVLDATDYTADITLTANWTVNQYTITFANTGDSTIAPITKDYGSAVDAVADPSKYGYTFAGWDKDIPTTMPAENTTITAKWTATEYTITYNLNDGAWPSDTTPLTKYTIETVSQSFPEPSRTTYSFVGWYTDSNFTESSKLTGITKGDITKGNITVYAKWEQATYSITYDLNGGAYATGESNPATVLISNPKVTVSVKPTKQYYDFAGWDVNGADYSADKTEFTLNGNSTFTANWEKTKYTVTLDVNGGDAMASNTIQVQYDEVYGTLPTPSRTGYTFAGWFTAASGGTQVTDTTVITEDAAKAHTLYAHWTANKYTITCDKNDGTDDDTYTVYHTYGTTTGIPAPTRTGYTFDGWTITGEGVETTKTAAGYLYLGGGNPEYAAGITLTANWTANTYTVTLVLNDGGDELTSGVDPETMTVTYDSPYGLPKPTRPGYKFVGWFTEAEGGTQVTAETTVTATEDQTLYAHWTWGNVWITKDGNGGYFTDGGNSGGWSIPYTGTDTTYEAFLNDPEVTDPIPTRTGYYFIGWNTAADGSGAWITAADKLTTRAPHTLYAQWGYGVVVGDVHVFAGNASDVLGDGKVSYDFETNTLTLNNATITGGSDGTGTISAAQTAQNLPLTIKLTGTNTVTNTLTSGDSIYGVYSATGLIFDGDSNAKLTITTGNVSSSSQNFAIYIGGTGFGQYKLTVQGGCSVTAVAGTGGTSSGVYVSAHVHVVKGTLIAKGYKYGVLVNGYIYSTASAGSSYHTNMKGSTSYNGTLSKLSAIGSATSSTLRDYLYIQITT